MQYKKELKAAYKKGDRYYLLKKKLSFEDYKAFREFPLVRLVRNKSGVIVETDSKRLVLSVYWLTVPLVMQENH